MNTLKAKLALWLAAASTLVLTAPARPAETAGRTTLELRPETALARAVQPFVDSNTLAGAVMLVVSNDRVLGPDAVGWADIAPHKPMATDALFWIASQSKPMTAAAFMMLVERGQGEPGRCGLIGARPWTACSLPASVPPSSSARVLLPTRRWHD